MTTGDPNFDRYWAEWLNYRAALAAARMHRDSEYATIEGNRELARQMGISTPEDIHNEWERNMDRADAAHRRMVDHIRYAYAAVALGRMA